MLTYQRDTTLEHPEIHPLLSVKKMEKRLENFGRKLLTLVNPATGRIHGDYHLPMITGRLSCRRPNLQNLPPDARAAFTPGEGKVLLTGDFSQIELRIYAEHAGEDVMREAFARGEDLHELTASRQVGKDVWDTLTKDERKPVRAKGKSSNFGTIYGMRANGLRKKIWADHSIVVSLAEAERMLDEFFATYPAVRRYQEDKIREGRSCGVLYSVAGRPRRARWEKDGQLWATVCCNYETQASAADVLLDAMARVDMALPGMLIASVHDELVLEVPEDRAEHVAEILSEQMRAAVLYWFPDMPECQDPGKGLVEVKIVKRWSDAK